MILANTVFVLRTCWSELILSPLWQYFHRHHTALTYFLVVRLDKTTVLSLHKINSPTEVLCAS